MDVRRRFVEVLSKFWWIIALLLIGGAIFTKVAIFKYIVFVIAIPFLIFLFLPFFIQLFAPAFFLFSSLVSHFKEAKNMPLGKKYIFIPMALLSVVVFILAQTVLSIWVFIVSFITWADLIGAFLATLLIFFFGLAPLAILTAPFVLWIRGGLSIFLNIGIFFLMALFWYGLSNLALSENYYSSTSEDYLGYSPQTFLLGALATQVLALPLYQFKAFRIGELISEIGGLIFLGLTVIAAIKWFIIKKGLDKDEKLSLYKPSVWAYILGFLITDFLYAIFNSHQVSTIVLMWLNLFFAFALIGRFIGFIQRKLVRQEAL